MRKITLSICLMCCFWGSVYGQLVTVVTGNYQRTGDYYKSGSYAVAVFNDTFSYDANDPRATSPAQIWNINLDSATVPNSCVVTNPNPTTNVIQCDYDIAPNTRLFAIDVWGRRGINGSSEERFRNLYFTLTNGTDTWTSPEWSGVSGDAAGAYGRYLFTADDIPEALLTSDASLKIGRKSTDNSWLQLYEVRLVATVKQTTLEEVTISNPLFSGAKYVGEKYHLGEFVLNDTFSYNPNEPLSDNPTQGWLPDTASHCYGKLIDNPKWECDFTIEEGRELYALDLWGRVWLTEVDGAYLSSKEAGAVARSQNLILKLSSHDQSVEWTIDGAWAGTSSDKEGAYGRYLFQAVDIPDEIAKNGGHLTITKVAGQFLHIDELRLVSSPLRNRVPEAKLPADSIVFSRDSIVLDASLSSDADGDSLRYIWSSDAGVSLSNNDSIHPYFIVPEVSDITLFSVYLKVSDGKDTADIVSQVFTVYPYGVNILPTVDAGHDTTLANRGEIYLDGSGSFDIQGDSLSFVWRSLTSALSLNDSSAIQPYFYAPLLEQDSSYGFELIVNDGHVDSPADTVWITVKSINRAPIAHAGYDKVISVGDVVRLDGTYSFDSDSYDISYAWSSIGDLVLESSNSATPLLTATKAGTFYFVLKVYDGDLYSENDTVKVLINTPPVADAGRSSRVVAGADITLDASKSIDADGDSLSYVWTSEDVGLVLSDVYAINPRFVVPNIPGASYRFTLVVSDSISSSLATVEYTVNTPPVADAGINQFAEVGDIIKLDASMSYDADGDSLSYHWSVVGQTSLLIQNSDSVSAQFIAPQENVFVTVALVVSDGIEMSRSSQVEISVIGETGIVNSELAPLTMYPNPLRESLTVDLRSLLGEVTIEVFNSIGAQVKMIETEGGELFNIDCSSLMGGLYMLKCSCGTMAYSNKIQILD